MAGRRRSAARRTRRAVAIGVALASVLLAARARATIEEQRARLPPAAECDDETVAGIWRSHSYHPAWSEWGIFTLDVRRVPGRPSELTGTITLHDWTGGPEQSEPPPCAQQAGWEWYVSMDARGSVTPDGAIRFGGVGAWRLDRVVCGRAPGGYNLDQFSGVIDPAILEFQSVNNDGGRAVQEPEVFRRIRCPPVESAVSPAVTTAPPPFYPGAGGCSMW